MMPAVVDPYIYARATVIVPAIAIVAVSVIWSRRADTDANTARTGVKAHLRHCRRCRKKCCRCQNTDRDLFYSCFSSHSSMDVTLARRRRSVMISTHKFTNLDGTIGGTPNSHLRHRDNPETVCVKWCDEKRCPRTGSVWRRERHRASPLVCSKPLYETLIDPNLTQPNNDQQTRISATRNLKFISALFRVPNGIGGLR